MMKAFPTKGETANGNKKSGFQLHQNWMENKECKTLGIITEGEFDVNMKGLSRCWTGK